jgi:hypothetical protein
MAVVERLLRQQLQHRQREAGGLAGAGLRRAEQIAPGEDDGDGLRLDGGGLGVALLGDGLEQLGREAETFKRSIYETLLMWAQERTRRISRTRRRRLPESAWEGLAFAPVQADELH